MTEARADHLPMKHEKRHFKQQMRAHGKQRKDEMKRLLLIAALSLLALTQLATPAGAATPPFFTQFPPGLPGRGAGQLTEPSAIAMNPSNHHVYVSDEYTNRINEFTAWGAFVQAFGWGVKDGSPELQHCTEATGCREALTGSGDGEFGKDPVKGEYRGPSGLAADPAGNLYAMDLGNFRVQKFDADGNFLLTFGGGVNKTKVAEREAQEANAEPVTVTAEEENVCTAASADECGAGRVGTDPWELSIENVTGVGHDSLTVGPDGLLYVGDKDRIQAFSPDGSFDHELPLPEPGNPGGLAADPVSGDLYFTFNVDQARTQHSSSIRRLDPITGQLIGKLEPTLSEQNQLDKVGAVAVDSGQNLFAVDDPYLLLKRTVEFGPTGAFLGGFDAPTPDEVDQTSASLVSIEAGAVRSSGAEPDDIYVGHFGGPFPTARIKVYGPVPDPAVVGPPPKVPPTIAEQYASAVGTEEATLKAAINPHFWDDTTYFLQYGTGKCSEGGCTQEQPLPPGSLLTKKVTNETIASQGVFLTGLQPGTTYHYRFVAQGSGSEGQPVFAAESAFTTRTPAPAPNRECANQTFRVAAAALLPDCRAYEMVSPVEKSGADVSVAANVTGYPAGLDQLDPSGEELSYSVYRSFGDSPAGPYTSQYLASRDPAAGWSSHSITAPGKGGSVLTGTFQLDREYRAFSTDLSQGWLFSQNGVPLDPNAPEGYANLYRRKSDGSYEAMVTLTPPATSPETFVPRLQGMGGECTVFSANDKLTEDAAATSNRQLYENCGGVLSLVSMLPTGGAAPEASAGTLGGDDRAGQFANAVSADGSKVFWSNDENDPGKLYARIDGSETLALSKGPARFLTAAVDGSKAIYTEGKDLFEFTLGVNKKEKGTLIVSGFKGFLAASEDASRLYLLSSEELDEGAEADKPNLYLYEAGEEGQLGSFTYIATLADADAISLDDSRTGPVRPAPFFHTAQASPDGRALLFDSATPLTGYDNKDARSGEPDTEVFLYQRSAGALTCLSCDPSGARPAGRNADLAKPGDGRSPQWTAATIPGAQSSLYTPRALSEDGGRAFFTSYVPLAQRDSNGAADVYEWEAEGHGDCGEGTLGYDPAWGGCVNLISSGESAADAQLLDSSADGRDAFFKTYSSLLPQDPGLRDIYDARAGGGFPPPPSNPAPCEGEACQSPPEPPNDPTPASSAFEGAGNVAQPKAAKKKHKAHKHKRAHGKRRNKR